MSGWDIEPAGVSGTLKKTASAAEPIASGGKSLAKGLNQVLGGCGSELVASALQGYGEHEGRELGQIASRVGAVMGGAAKATRAYVAGDEEMAAAAQRAVTVAPDPRLRPD